MANSYPFKVGKLSAEELNNILGFLYPLDVRKASDESLNSSTTLQNDDELFLSVPADCEYKGELVVYGTSAANAAGHIKIGFSFPTGATLHFGAQGPNNASLASGSQSDLESVGRLSATSGSTVVPFGLSTSTITMVVPIRLIVGSTAGTLQMMWAQNASNANNSTVKAGSHMTLYRVA